MGEVGGDGLIELGMNLLAQMPDDAIERAERR